MSRLDASTQDAPDTGGGPQPDSPPQTLFYLPLTSQLWDTWLYYHEGLYYLYHLTMGDTPGGWHGQGVALATSRNGVHWEEVGLVLPKAKEAVGLGTGSIWKSENFEQDGRFIMNYSEWFETPINSQFIRFAESTDLIHWKRLGLGCDFHAEPRWYQTYPEFKGTRWDCIYTIPRPGGGRYGYWTANPKGGAGFGFGESLDGVHWKALEPPKIEWGNESAPRYCEAGAVEKIGQRYYMLLGAGGMVTLVADQPQGPFRPTEKNYHLLRGHTYFARFFPTPNGLLVNHHAIPRTPRTCRFAPLKVPQVDREGTLRLAYWPGNEKAKGEPVVVELTASERDGLPVAMLSRPLDAEGGFILEGKLPLGATGAAATPNPADVQTGKGLFPPPIQTRSGLYVEFQPSRGLAILCGPGGVTEFMRAQDSGKGFVSEMRIDREMDLGPTARFRLLIQQSLLEFYLDDVLIQCYSLPANATGRVGLILPPAGERPDGRQERAAADPLYPKYHVAAPFGWMNDPHPIYFKGVYHIFYQYSFLPDDPYGGPHSWGHAVSSDLVRWRHLPVAITPQDHGIAKDRHIWSGCVVDHDGEGTAIYTIENIDIWMATSTDADLAIFHKHPGNPVIKGPPPGLEIEGGMRDPWVWKEADGWYLIVGTGLKGGKGPVLPLYTSPDLIHWRYLHPLYEGSSPRGEGRFCECPSFFPLANKHVLVLSHEATYLVGRYGNHRFVPESRGRLDYGGVYVPQFALDGKGRRILWGWVLETRPRDAQQKAGWAGMQTLPRVVSLDKDGSLAFEPAEELVALRGAHRRFEKIWLPADATHVLEGVEGGQLEIAAVFEPSETGIVGIALLEGDQKTEILLDAKAKVLRCKARTAPLELRPGERLTLRVFVDASVVEVFANHRLCLTERMYPAHPESLCVALVARGADATLERADVWKMGTIWE